MKIIELEEIDSTNEYCKRIDVGEDVIVIAERQTAGKGTKGRSFVSAEGGLYVSVMRHYKDAVNYETFRIMVNSCVAVCKTLEELKIKPVIRWANDVLVGGKKICGTLIENTFSGGELTRSIVGIGLNINNILPQELCDIATTIKEASGKSASVKKVGRLLINNLQQKYSVEEYKKYIDYFGTVVTLKLLDKEVAATALDVDECGRLVCDMNGKIERISSAEVSLRING